MPKMGSRTKPKGGMKAKTRIVIVDKQELSDPRLAAMLASFGGTKRKAYRVTTEETDAGSGKLVSTEVALMVVPSYPELD